jgi:zinc transporter ZupT
MTNWLIPVAFGAAASVTTMLGGLFALKSTGRMTFVLAVAAGVVLGVAGFDLLPEALELAVGRHPDQAIFVCAAVGFTGYFLLNRMLAKAKRTSDWRAHLGPATLTLHSFLDGAAMGLAFQVSTEIGWVVAAAVLTHDLADGINTVSLALAASKRRAARGWLLANGSAPLLGVLVGLTVRLSPWVLAPLLAVLAGVFLYIGTCELIPHSLKRTNALRTGLGVVSGVAFMLVISTLAH